MELNKDSASKLSQGLDEDAVDIKDLSSMFDQGFELYTNLDKMSEPTNSSEVQSEVRRIMKLFENATRLVSLVGMFSGNESFDEVATENIKYFLLPALLGMLTTKICGAENRLHIVDITEIYFVDFLKRLKNYEIIDIEIPDTKNQEENEGDEGKVVVLRESNAQMISDMVNKRNTKIKRYKEQKDLEGKLETLRKTLEDPKVDDEVKRDYFVTLVKIFSNQVIDELSSLAMERKILDHGKHMGRDETSEGPMIPKPPKKPNVSSLKPIIITRDVIQKNVYGAGYPSLPVLTVDEFYEQRVKDGDWPSAASRNQIGSKSLQDYAAGKVDGRTEEEREEMRKEKLEEEDDEETIARARAMDEYKDSHKRGWGNRYNRS